MDFSLLKLTVPGLTGDCTKVIDEISEWSKDSRKAINKVLNCWLGKAIAKREAEINLTKAQTKQNVRNVESGDFYYNNESTEIIPLQIQNCNLYDQFMEMLSTLKIAINELKEIPDDQISGDELDRDFWNKWQREAEILNQDELKQIWAKILVEEVKKTGSISKRTLDIVKNLSKKECMLFEQILASSTQRQILTNSSGIPVNSPNIILDDFLILYQTGLILPSNRETFTCYTAGKNLKGVCRSIVNLDNHLCLIADEEIKHSSVNFSSSGKELIKSLDIKMNIEQATNIAEFFVKNNPRIHIALFKVKHVIEDAVTTEDSPIWESKNCGK